MVMGDMSMEVDLVVLGAGAGGCSAAFRAAELGFDVALVDENPTPGGNYLHNSCIPFHGHLQYLRASLPSLTTQEEKRLHKAHLDQTTIFDHNKKVIAQIAKSLQDKCHKSGVLYIHGKAFYESPTLIRLKDSEYSSLHCKYSVIATGSYPRIPKLVASENGKRILTIPGLLSQEEVLFTGNTLIVGGGHSGLELATILSHYCTDLTIYEKSDLILPALDDDVISHLQAVSALPLDLVQLSREVVEINESHNKVVVKFNHKNEAASKEFDQVILATGRKPQADNLGLENAGIELDPNGFIVVDETGRTAHPQTFAVGDVCSSEMYAHTAAVQGKVAAEVIGGHPSAFEPQAIAKTIHIQPSISWCGFSEKKAQEKSIPIKSYLISWTTFPQRLATGRDDGLTKVVTSASDGRVLGATIVGAGSEELITKYVLAVEMGALIEDLNLIVDEFCLSESS